MISYDSLDTELMLVRTRANTSVCTIRSYITTSQQYYPIWVLKIIPVIHGRYKRFLQEGNQGEENFNTE